MWIITLAKPLVLSSVLHVRMNPTCKWLVERSNIIWSGKIFLMFALNNDKMSKSTWLSSVAKGDIYCNIFFLYIWKRMENNKEIITHWEITGVIFFAVSCLQQSIERNSDYILSLGFHEKAQYNMTSTSGLASFWLSYFYHGSRNASESINEKRLRGTFLYWKFRNLSVNGKEMEAATIICFCR